MELCMQQTNAATETDNSKRTPALLQQLKTEATPKKQQQDFVDKC